MTTTQRIIKELHIMGAISEQTALNAKEVAELADTKQAHARLCELRDQGLVIASSRTGKNKYWLTLAGVEYAEKMEAPNTDQVNNAIENSKLNDVDDSQSNSENVYPSENSDQLDEKLDISALAYNPPYEMMGSALIDDVVANNVEAFNRMDDVKAKHEIPPPQYNPDDVAFKKSDTVFWFTVDGIKEVFETSTDAIHAAQELVKNRKIVATIHAVASKHHAIIKPVVTTELEYL